MKKHIFFSIFFGLLILITIGSNHADATATQLAPTRTLYLLGDSWTQQMADDFATFDKALAERNLTDTVQVSSFAVSGSTAAGWADDSPCDGNGCPGRFTDLKTAIAQDPLANPVVFFTLGGNDLLRGFLANQEQSAIFAQIDTDLTQVVSEIKATRGDVTIVFTGYDILNPAVVDPITNFDCNLALQFAFGSTDPAVVNPNYVEMFNVHAAVADKFDDVHVVNGYGSLQGNPSNPTLSAWSPVKYVADCIHLKGTGYDIFMKTIFDAQLETALRTNSAELDKMIFLPAVVR